MILPKIALIWLSLFIQSVDSVRVYFLAGQSNMDGIGYTMELPDSLKRLPENVLLYVSGKATETDTLKQFGPEIGFAHALAAHHPHDKIILVKRAVGGVSTLAWSPNWSKEKANLTDNAWAGFLYQAIWNDFGRIANIHGLTSNHIRGLLWMQGERDARYPLGAEYKTNLWHIISAFRKDSHQANLPVHIGLINPPPEDHHFAPVVRQHQREIAQEDPHSHLIETDDLPKHNDRLHYTSQGQILLGQRFAESTFSHENISLSGWDNQAQIVGYMSGDGSIQKAVAFESDSTNARPLLVGLHTWSGDYRQREGNHYLILAKEKGWHFIHPDNRGPNKTPKSAGSDWVIFDIEAAVAFAKTQFNVDTSRVYLVGSSGGGYAALLAAGRLPHLWTAVSAWVPITDLRAWHKQTKERDLHYWKDVELATGGAPDSTYDIDFEYVYRSPLTHLSAAQDAFPIHIHAGINDGYDGDSVPISHSINAFNLLAKPEDRLSRELIEALTEKREVPKKARFKGQAQHYGKKQPLFRRKSGKVTLTLFEGGHEIIEKAAIEWLARQK